MVAGARRHPLFRVDDIDAAIAPVRALGGAVEDRQEGPASVTRPGRFALRRDDRGSPFGPHRPP